MNYKFYLTSYSLEVIKELSKNYHPRYQANYFDRYIYIMDYAMRYANNYHNSVPIRQADLANHMGVSNSVASNMVKSLVSNGCLEIKKLPEVGVTSTCFGIPDEHEECYEVCPTNKSSMAYKIIRKKKYGRDYLKSKEGQLYSKYLKCIYIDNYTDVSNSIELLYVSPMMESYKIRKVIKKQKTNLLRIKNKQIFVTRKDPLSRVCCNFSILHHKLRKHLRYDGHPLSCVDLRNSQPLLAGMYIKKNILQTGGETFDELELYLRRCEKGMFYEDFMNEDGNINRKDFKQQFFAEVFFSKVTKRKTKLKKKFIAKYPRIYEIICDIKGGTGSEEYKQFAIGMQRFEASIIYDKINMPMLQEGYKCFNIYDSIVSHSKEVLDEAKRRIYIEFAKYGVTPTLNIEDFTNY